MERTGPSILKSWRKGCGAMQQTARYFCSNPSPDSFIEPIHVLGAGSVGLLLAASLRVAFPSYPVRLLLREHHRQSPEEDRPDVLVNLIQKRRLRTVKVPSQIIHPNFVPQRKFRNVLLATKAYQAVDALNSIRQCLSFHNNGTQIVLLCNGALATRDDILKHFPELNPSNLHTALTTHGAFRERSMTQENHGENRANHLGEDPALDHSSSTTIMMDVIHAGQGRLDFPPSLAAWTPLFDRAGLNAHTLTGQQMQVQLWRKLAANCLINPLTAIHNCTNGKVLELDEWNDMLRHVPEEVAQVAAQSQLWEDELVIQASSLRDFCREVVASTMENRSSMLQDVCAGRRTEIDALNGYVVRLGEEYGVTVPANRNLYERVLRLTGAHCK